MDFQFPPLADPAETQSDFVARLYSWWRVRRSDNQILPKWSVVEVRELIPWIGWLIVYGIAPDLSDAEYRLIGSRIVEKVGYDLTGKRVSQATYTLRPELVLFNLRRIIQTGDACLQTNDLEVNRTERTRSSERLWLPFSEDGEVVNRLLLFQTQITVLRDSPSTINETR